MTDLGYFESESSPEVQFVINSCRFNYLNNSKKGCAWLILECYIREQCTADVTFTPLKKKFGLKIQRMHGEIMRFFIIKQLKKPRLRSVLL